MDETTQTPQPVKEVAALKYSMEDDAVPVVVALGRGAVAEKILDKAREADVPIVPDANLAHVLNQLSVGDEIPSELYTVVAQILVYVSQMDEKFARRMGL